jgi:3-oxoadipate enol-lactonase
VRARLLRTDPAGYLASCHAVAAVDWLEHLSAVRVPTLVLAGARDAGATPEMARAIAERIGGAELRVFADASHLSVAEAGDAFHAAVAAFLAGLPR